MGRTADSSDDEGDGAASDEDDGDEETALKRRKVVLVKAQPATAEQEAEDNASKAVASSAPRPRAKPLAGGTAGRILREMLGQPSRLERRAADREHPQRQERPQEPAQISSTVASSASTDAGRSRPPTAAAKKAVEAVKRQSSAAPIKIVKTKLAKPSTESKKATLSKRSALSVTSGQKEIVTASATLKEKAVRVLREATLRSASPCSPRSPELRPPVASPAPGAGAGKKNRA